MITRLIVARHGNTFKPNETPRRIGSNTDLPLTELIKGKAIGSWLSKNKIIPSKIYSAPLIRTKQTAELILEQLGLDIKIQIDKRFSEIDYGPDENKTEEDVWQRLGNLTARKGTNNTNIINLGKEIIQKWNTKGEVPSGWKVNTTDLKSIWDAFATKIENDCHGENVLVVTSNGIARFSPVLTKNFELFSEHNHLKIATGALCIFEKSSTDHFWKCKAWNLTP